MLIGLGYGQRERWVRVCSGSGECLLASVGEVARLQPAPGAEPGMDPDRCVAPQVAGRLEAGDRVRIAGNQPSVLGRQSIAR